MQIEGRATSGSETFQLAIEGDRAFVVGRLPGDDGWIACAQRFERVGGAWRLVESLSDEPARYDA